MGRPATAAVRLLTGDREPVRLATTGPIDVDIGGLLIIDGVQTAVGDRVLVKDQADGSENGIRTASTGQWYRAADARTARTMQKGTTATVQEGAVNANKVFRFTTLNPEIGDDPIVIVENTVVGGITPGAAGLTILATATMADVRDVLDVVVYVATRTALKALDTTKDTTAYLNESGREGVFIWTTGNFSASITADTAEGIYVKANAVASTAGAWVRKGGWHVQGADARWFGAVADYNPTTKVGTSIHTAINAAFAVVPWLVLPSGNMLLSNKITLDATGLAPKKLTGADRRSSLVYANSGFTLAATAMFDLTGPAGNDTELHTVGNFTVICQDQPDDPNVANYINYPPVIRCIDQPRVNLFKMQIQEAWIGIDMTGQCGGMVMDDMEISAYSKGIKIAGSTDSVKISRLAWWPFGFPQTTNKRAVFATARGIETMRCDDFHLTNSLLFGSVQALYAGNTGGVTFGEITGVDFDARGGLVTVGGILSLAGCVFTLGQTDAQCIMATSARLNVSSTWFNVSAQSSIGKAIDIVGGYFSMNNCTVDSLGIDDNIIRLASGAQGNINDNNFVVTDAVTYANALILNSASKANVVGNTGSTFTSGSRTFVSVTGTSTGVIADNNTPFAAGVGWNYSVSQSLANMLVRNNLGKNGDRGVMGMIIGGDVAKADVATAQNIFTSNTDELVLESNTTYEFEAQYVLSRSAGTTSHTFSVLFGGTTVLASMDFVAEWINPTGNIAAAPQMLRVTSTSAVLTAANTSATEDITVKLRGVVRITTGGTIIPQFQYSAAPGGAPTIKRNSFFLIRQAGLDTMGGQGALS
ncbi:hypothetical protein LB531_20920 [Mesorhizobium sp. CO1-1-2]|uniref:hypothetical protein n=1 Tax=Mesorhizobium sp. CO1-1-2 TaxID=2876635 RepID=UPI001CCB2BA5|nr:hypothetical protein [Mesorhizobium sp. CO1-1-2]MBZ9683124.1 hypothetical protein [Mesorhizobium sp. CO1-1-2]